MGLRADITPQVARIDSHLLNRKGVVRLCYCGSVVHALPAGFNATREPIQLGAEIYGHAGIEADVEAGQSAAASLDLAQVAVARIDFGHVGISGRLTRSLGLGSARRIVFRNCSRAAGKDVPALRNSSATRRLPVRDALQTLARSVRQDVTRWHVPRRAA
jgi:ATP phosphoribosyltransferase regulatory subunit